MQAPAFLDLAHQAAFSAMGKHMQVADSAQTNKEEAGGFGKRQTGPRTAAGFTQVELAATRGVADKRQVLRMLDTFIEPEPLKRKVENRP